MKRIIAIVLPDLACELVAGLVHPPSEEPFAVIVDDDPEPSDEPVKPSAVLHAVDRRAWQYGARPGQKAAQASAFVSKLTIVRLARARLLEALGSVAEVALAFGTTAGFDLRHDDNRLRDDEAVARYPAGAGAGPYDTVWLDVSGCSRLRGGDDLLCAELRERIEQLGHRARVAIADGPRIAQALARWSSSIETVVPPGTSAEHLAPLPVAALPLTADRLSWLGKLGIFRVADVARLDRKRLTPRLGRQASDLVDLLAGHDDVPVVAYERPRCIVEQASFDHELEGLEPLFFVLRGLTGRAVSRLAARGEACSLASIVLELDRAILRLAETEREVQAETEQRLEIELPVPLSSENELLRALHAKLERLELAAPVRAVRLTLDGLAPQRHHQLTIDKKSNRDPHALPTLLAELSAWLGSDRVGVLELVDAHRPEARSRLVPCDPEKPAASLALDPDVPPAPTRMLPEPIEIGSNVGRGGKVLTSGSLVAAEHHLFILDRTRLSHRLEAVEWWTRSPLQRDYLRAWLHGTSASAGSKSSGKTDRASGKTDRASGKTDRASGGEGTPRFHTEHVEASLFVVRDEQGPRFFLHGWLD